MSRQSITKGSPLYRSLNHEVGVSYHVVFIPKYRKKAIYAAPFWQMAAPISGARAVPAGLMVNHLMLSIPPVLGGGCDRLHQGEECVHIGDEATSCPRWSRRSERTLERGFLTAPQLRFEQGLVAAQRPRSTAELTKARLPGDLLHAFRWPIYQSLNGPQPKETWRLEIAGTWISDAACASCGDSPRAPSTPSRAAASATPALKPNELCLSLRSHARICRCEARSCWSRWSAALRRFC